MRSSTPFYIGFANSIFQSSGLVCGESNWTEAANLGTVPSPGVSIRHWQHFERDLDDMAKLGINSYRFSIEWSHIEPRPGEIDYLVLARYAELVRECRKRNIEPLITLYHFTEPKWFTDLGGFEKARNISYFVRFCNLVFTTFKSDVKLWTTLNEPAVQIFMGYLLGIFPPHKHSLNKAITVLINLLSAHVAVYNSLKSLPGGAEAQVGIIHNVMRFVPRFKREPIEYFLTKYLTRITNSLVMDFLKCGNLNVSRTFKHDIHYYEPSAPFSYDFIGLNFYANPIIGFNSKNIFGATSHHHQVMTDMYLTIDPNGLGQAIDEVSTLGKPIIITETGIADKHDRLRNDFLQQYTSVVYQKLQEGLDIRGFYLWTFADNYEWDKGYKKHFGLFDRARNMRNSGHQFRLIVEQFKSGFTLSP